MATEGRWLLTCAAVAAGEAIGFALGDFAFIWPMAAGATIFAVALGYGYAWRCWPSLATLLLGLTLALVATERRQRILDEALEVNAGRPLEAELTVGEDLRTEPGRGGRTGFTFAGEVRGIPVRVHLQVAPHAPHPAAGEVWRCTGWLGRSSDGPFGRRRPFWIGGRGTSAERTASAPGGVRAFWRRVRTDLSRRVGLGLDRMPATADLNRAMLLGERFRIGEADRRAFIAAGTIHVFAISGLHVLFVAQLLRFLLVLLRLPRRGVCLVLLPLVWAYVAVTGCGPSAVRAATMASFYYGASLFWRRPNALTAWAIAFLLTYVLEPSMWFDAGCAFSFTVMLALVLWQWWYRPFACRWAGRLGFAGVAWLAGMPLAAHVFGRITPGGLIANLAVVPLAGVSVMTSALGLLASGLSDRLAGHFNNFAGLTTNLMAGLSRVIGAGGWSTCEVEPWSIGRCFVSYLAFAAFFLVLRFLLLRRRARLS